MSNKNPSIQLQKFGLNSLPEDFVPTEEEKTLLEMYEIVRNTERVAARLKEEAARNKLNARNEEFNKKQSETKKKKRGKLKEKKKIRDSDAEESDNSEDVDEDDEDASSVENEDDLYEKREAKLEKMREEVEVAKQAQMQQDTREDELRAEHLGTATDIADGQTILRRKRNFDAVNEAPSSLIANLTAAVTPPHDFSKQLELENGTILFPITKDEITWSPPEGVDGPNDRAFMVILEGFDVSRAQVGAGNNTLAIKFTAPPDSRRFSFNIAAPDHDDFDSILFHFNPRQREKGGQVVVNDKKQGNWGQALNIPLSQLPLMFGQTSCTLIIQINGDGFDIFLEGKHCARLEHRTELPAGDVDLVLQFPSTDDYGTRENWAVYKAWWGNRPIMAKGDLSGIAGVNSYNALHPRKLFISGLTKIYKEADVDLRRAELERAFQKYAGARGAHVIVPTKSTFAFVEFETERQADLALSEMSQTYRLNRARRSKHEALQEERAAKEAASGKKPVESEWS